MRRTLPVSPVDPAFRNLCQRKQLDYIAAERFRMARAAALPEYPGNNDGLPEWVRGAWHGLNLHPLRPAEIAARNTQLDEMEAQALHDSEWLDWTAQTGAMLGNRPAVA